MNYCSIYECLTVLPPLPAPAPAPAQAAVAAARAAPAPLSAFPIFCPESFLEKTIVFLKKNVFLKNDRFSYLQLGR